jgi:nicotinamidase-related amidase
VSRTALIVIDMINAYEHPDADRLTKSVEKVLPTIADRIEESDATIYVNDNFGHWRSDHRALIDRALASDAAPLVEPLVPDEDAMFVVKARHSIFYETPFGYLLTQEGIEEIVLTGQATEQCILYSALDAHIRHIPVVVPREAVAHIHADLAEAALRMMELNMEAEVVGAGAVAFEAERAGA